MSGTNQEENEEFTVHDLVALIVQAASDHQSLEECMEKALTIRPDVDVRNLVASWLMYLALDVVQGGAE